MAKREWFEDWFGSPYHKILYAKRTQEEAGIMVQHLVQYLNAPPGSLALDVGCGEGRFAIPLAERGFQVVGIDLEEQRILKAQQHTRPGLSFYVHDMRNLFRANFFDYVFNFFTSFGYFEKNRDTQRAAKAIAQSLKPGGILVIDFLNSQKTISSLVKAETFTRQGIHFNIEREYDGRRIIKTIHIEDAGQNHRYQEKVTAFSHEELIRLFEAHHLVYQQTFGDYTFHPFDPQSSSRMILFFKKSSS